MTMQSNALEVHRRRWLVLFNCQAEGLANSLECLVPGLRVDRTSMLVSGQIPERFLSSIDAYERIIIAPRVRNFVGQEIADRANVTWLPHVLFQGYHPDLCYLSRCGPLAAGYHSAIAWAGFRAGLDSESAMAFFNKTTYEAMGYFDSWVPARDRFCKGFADHGIDVRECFVRWSRKGPFMYTLNHPKIHVLLDLARLLLRSFGIEPKETGYIPHDNLANGPGFPVYPEIALRLGMESRFFFKNGGGYHVYDLRQFVEGSFARYRAAGDRSPDDATYLPTLERAVSVVEALK